MAEKTRTQIRRAIGKMTGQNFFRRYGGEPGEVDSGTPTTLVDADLLGDEDNYWRGDFVYLPDSDEIREISASDQGTTTLTWLSALAGAPSNGDDYEIWSQFTPAEIHLAINNALSEAWPWFFETEQDETTVLLESKGLFYDLPTTYDIKRLTGVYLMGYDSTTSTTTSEGTTTQIIDTSASFDSDDVGKYITVYDDDGNAEGEIRQIQTVNSSTMVTVSVAFSEAVSSGASYRLIDKNTESPVQWPITNYKLDAPDGPTKIWLGVHYQGYEGCLLRFEYEREYSELSAESDTTTCPTGYLYPAILAHLYFIKMASAPSVETPTWEAMHDATRKVVERYIQTSKFKHAPTTMSRHNITNAGWIAENPFVRR